MHLNASLKRIFNFTDAKIIPSSENSHTSFLDVSRWALVHNVTALTSVNVLKVFYRRLSFSVLRAVKLFPFDLHEHCTKASLPFAQLRDSC